MAWLTLIADTDAEHAEALSDALLELGALSVDLLDADADTPDEQAIFGEPGEPPPGVWQHNRVSALFDADKDVVAILGDAAKRIGLKETPEHRVEPLADNDWVRLTQSQFEPIPISPRLWIVPTWHTPSDPTAINIALDPGLAFGTGSHPTTRLCLRWLDGNINVGESVLDYGCGSGILAIAALRLGAGRAVGVDVDRMALEAARYNAQRNGVALDVRDAQDRLDMRARITVANILANPLRMLAPAIAAHTEPGGAIALSGILASQASEVIAAYAPWAAMAVAGGEAGWVLVAGERGS
jgi:ribosomal protein L11 methyltransferase